MGNYLKGSKLLRTCLLIQGLDEVGKEFVRSECARALSRMFILFACVAGAALIVSLGIARRSLSEKYARVTVGLEKEMTVNTVQDVKADIR